MKAFILFLSVFVFTLFSWSQYQYQLLTTLPDSVNESSGLIRIGNKTITHNDSGDGAYLYEINPTDDEVLRTVYITNISHTDWEDITHDDDYIYIGDFGNNNGNRTNLMIYKINISDYLNSSNDSITAETITFNYTNQSDFSAALYQTNFDAETIIQAGDSLYIFTKNWGNGWTDIYPISKQAGNYSIEKSDSINVNGLITGGHFSESKNELYLCGYTFSQPFLVTVSDIPSTHFSAGTYKKQLLYSPSSHSIQTEAIYELNDTIFVTAEAYSGQSSGLYFISHSDLLSINPSVTHTIKWHIQNEILTIDSNDILEIKVYQLNGQCIDQKKGNAIDISSYSYGVYIFRILNTDRTISQFKWMKTT